MKGGEISDPQVQNAVKGVEISDPQVQNAVKGVEISKSSSSKCSERIRNF